MYKKAWMYIGFGLFALLLAINSVQYAEPAWGLITLMIIAGVALMAEGVKRRKQWIEYETFQERRHGFSF
jgi:uncharacterized membrane protein HdeD (DUF308 family)